VRRLFSGDDEPGAFEDAESGGEGLELRFGEKKGYVFGHEDITEEEELVTLPELFERLGEDDAGALFVQVGETVVTTEGDEVIVAFGLITFQTARHEVIVVSKVVGPHPCAMKLRMNGAPRILSFIGWATRHPAFYFSVRFIGRFDFNCLILSSS
jgi:hypothetical protein